jgi:hypothetical protein
MVDEARSWTEQLFMVTSETLDVDANAFAVELNPVGTPTGRIIDVRMRPYGSAYPQQYLHVNGVEMRTDESTDLFASGYALHFYQPFQLPVTIDVLYARRIDLSTSGVDDELDVTEGMTEILKWGALWRLLAGREAQRLDTGVHQQPSVAQGIPAGAQVQVAEAYRRLRNQLYAEEARRLTTKYPLRFF